MTETALDRTADTTPDFAVMFEELRGAFAADSSRGLEWRDQQLAALQRMMA
jgi:hypothetical protein